nr:MAG TPA: Repressor protein CI [Caudoviricetes sp.]
MNRLKELRQEKKLSQKELAENIRVHYRALQNWENGESQIKPEKAQQLADYFGVNVGYLLGYEPEGMPKRSNYEEVYSALLRVKAENPSHVDRVVIREVCMELIEATLEGY